MYDYRVMLIQRAPLAGTMARGDLVSWWKSCLEWKRVREGLHVKKLCHAISGEPSYIPARSQVVLSEGNEESYC